MAVDFKKLHELDLVGLSETDSPQPDWFKQAIAKPVVLFVDEIDYLKQVIKAKSQGAI